MSAKPSPLKSPAEENGLPGIVAGGSADDAKAVARGEVRQIDVGHAVRFAEDHIGRAGVHPPVRIFEMRADDEVGEPVAVDVAGGSDREPALARLDAVETNPLAWRQIGKIDVGPRRAAEHEVDRAGAIDPARTGVGRADDEIDDALAVHIAGRGDGIAGRVTLLADDAKAATRVEIGEVD